MTFDEIVDLETFTFDVTQEDISRGNLGDPCACPIARAINRTLGLEKCSTYVPPSISHYPIEITRPNENSEWHSGLVAHFDHSPESSKFVDDFDADIKVEPTTITLKRTVK